MQLYCSIVVPVRANKDIWLLGDVFLTEAVSVLMEMQHQNPDELHLFSDYDPQPYFPKLLDSQSFGKQITNQLFTALEEHNKLPSVIIIIIGNKQINKKVFNPEQTRRVWKALFTEIQRIIRTRKEDLPKKAQNQNKPRVLINNMFARFKDHNDKTEGTHESFKTKRHHFNSLLPQMVKDFDFSVLHITGLLPDNSEFFVQGSGQLNGRGMKQFWLSLSSEFKIFDTKQVELHKNRILADYFFQQKEARRIDQEKRKVAKDRLSLPRTLSFNEFDRGDGYSKKSQKRRDRSRSAPHDKSTDHRRNRWFRVYV